MRLPVTRTYDYIYTSVPFSWFTYAADALNDALAHAFRAFLKPRGLMIIDSIDVAQRNGTAWPVAQAQIAYFTEHGFIFEDSLTFATVKQQGICDETFTELQFSAPAS